MAVHFEHHLVPLFGSLEGYNTFPHCLDEECQQGTPCFQWGKNIIEQGKAFCEGMDQIERTYRLSASPHWRPLGKKIVQLLSETPSPEAPHLMIKVRQRMLGLRYREEGHEGKRVSEVDDEQIRRLAEEWRSKQFHLPPEDWEEAHEHVLSRVIAKYPKFVRLILKDDLLRHRFLTWVIRDRLSIESFVQFPCTQELLEDKTMGPCIHMAGPELLQIKRTKRGAKCLTLPLYGKHNKELASKPIKLWKQDKEYQFHAGYKATLATVFDHIKRRNKYWVDFIISEKGIHNWNARHWGPRNSLGAVLKIPLVDEWYRHVPVIERYTLEQAKQKYSAALDGTNCAVIVRASRSSPDLDVLGTHGYMDLCIPERDGKTYFLISPGKFTRIVPKNVNEMFRLLCDTVYGVVVSHDTSVVYGRRNQTQHPKIVSMEDFISLAEYMAKSIDEARNGNMVFSMAESCAKWVQEMMNQLPSEGPVKDNYFDVPIIETEPRLRILKNLLKFVKWCPKSIQPYMIKLIFLFFRPWRGKWIKQDDDYVWISYTRSESWKRNWISIPANLHKHQENGLYPTRAE